ncbi:hypothetical protein V3C99_008661 [Haemonchus contortus]|uniref:Reverse transcriptase domain-containing protein n=1 Tax=Haemonchus contortus TaxID=6289 RepID=A0A7I4YKH4_HAECO
MMDADELRAILSAQAAAQDKMLQAVMKKMRSMFSTMISSSTTAHTTSAEKARPVSYAAQPKISQEIHRLLERNALEQHQHPIPTPEDMFAKLNGERYFSQLDLAKAYLEIEVDEESRRLLRIHIAAYIASVT